MCVHAAITLLAWQIGCHRAAWESRTLFTRVVFMLSPSISQHHPLPPTAVEENTLAPKIHQICILGVAEHSAALQPGIVLGGLPGLSECAAAFAERINI